MITNVPTTKAVLPDLAEAMGNMAGNVVRPPGDAPKAVAMMATIAVFHVDQGTQQGTWLLEFSAFDEMKTSCAAALRALAQDLNEQANVIDSGHMT